MERNIGISLPPRGVHPLKSIIKATVKYARRVKTTVFFTIPLTPL